MKIGLFDHIEDANRPLSTLFDERLKFAQAADEAGFYCLHLAEHHATPLNMVPVPGVFLGALARVTRRMRLGTMVYLLPLYSPLRLIEEVCMIDHLSHGRFELGVGRGVSPFELNYHKVDHDDSRAIFEDAYAALISGLTQETFSHAGKYYNYKDVPIALQPLQRPYPPIWYGSSNTTGSTWAGERGLHFATNGPVARAKVNIDAFREALAKRGGAAQPKPEFKGGAAIGISRNIVVANTDEEAVRIARPAYEHHLANIGWLRTRHAGSDLAKRLDIPVKGDFDSGRKDGIVIAGSPATVLAEIEKQVDALGLNYMMAYLFFGTMSFTNAMHSLALFESEVMPKLRDL